jgi:hypothetical protein
MNNIINISGEHLPYARLLHTVIFLELKNKYAIQSVGSSFGFEKGTTL